MTRSTRTPDPALWSRYLAAEAAGEDDSAERALRDLFGALPELAPGAGFAGRVMAAVGAAALARPSLFSRRAVRWALASGLAAAALGIAALVPMLPALAHLIQAGSVIATGVDLLSRAALQLAAWTEVAARIGEVAGALARTASHPTIAALLVAQLVLAAVAFRALTALVSKGSPRHALS